MSPELEKRALDLLDAVALGNSEYDSLSEQAAELLQDITRETEMLKAMAEDPPTAEHEPKPRTILLIDGAGRSSALLAAALAMEAQAGRLTSRAIEEEPELPED